MDEEEFQMTDKGIANAKAALALFEVGKTHEEIAQILGLHDEETVRVLVTIADYTGVLD